MNDLFSDPHYFTCDKLHCKLKLAVCLGRQKANRGRKGFEALPFPECEKCEQGKHNRDLVYGQTGGGNPQRGQGRRNEDCGLYEDCLDHAAVQDWEGFHCEACSVNQTEEEKTIMTDTQKPENTRICEDCKTRKTISPQSSLCPVCMAKRSNKPKDPARSARSKKLAKPKYPSKDPGEISSPGADLKLVIDFGKYGAVLDMITDLAEEEMRPVELQAIFMLREYLRGLKEEEET